MAVATTLQLHWWGNGDGEGGQEGKRWGGGVGGGGGKGGEMASGREHGETEMGSEKRGKGWGWRGAKVV